MRLEFLGTGGAIPTPRPGCHCRLCDEARARGVPYSRMGPAVFVHGPDVLIDTPEDIVLSLNRAQVDRVAACFYSHWHPDHTQGRRVFEALNMDYRHWPPRSRRTTVYLPPGVAADFRTRLGLQEHFAYMQRLGLVEVHALAEGEQVAFGEAGVEAIALADPSVYAFLWTTPGGRTLIAPDELVGWSPPERLRGVDLAVLPAGVQEVHPLTGERQVPADHPILRIEATFDQTLGMVRALQPRRTLLMHIEEADGTSYDDLLEIAARLNARGGLGGPLEFAFDGLSVEMP